MKKSRKILAGVMALCLMGGVTVIPESIAPMVSIMASAVDTYEGLTYKIGNDDTVTITGYDKSMTDIVIPDTIEGLPVVAIGNKAFQGGNTLFTASKITSIKLPSTLKTIGSNAFEYCKNITSMYIPDGVTSIEAWAFNGCSSLETITLPDSLTTVDSFAFSSCSNLETLALPESVTSIGNSAFIYCEKITELTIPDGVTRINDYTFKGCKSLGSITIPDSVTHIENYAFENCISLERVVIPASVEIIGGIFGGCENIKELVILNPEAKISNLDIPKTANYTIYGYEGSTAEEYAQKVDVRFKVIGESSETTTTTTAKLFGDANGDGDVSLADAVFIMQGLSNPDEYQLDEIQVLNADVVDAGSGLTTMDALAIQLIGVNLISLEDLPITSEKLTETIQ